LARESALQILFELEFIDAALEAVINRYWKEKKASAAIKDYANWLVGGIVARKVEIDELIQGHSKHWRISRMAFVDRNILRIAVFELLEEQFMAPAIVINEALEIAKRYSGDESTVFINGVLDAVRKKVDKKNPDSEVKDHEPKKEAPKKRTARSDGRRKKE